MVNHFEMSHTVAYYEADQSGKLSLPMLVNVALLASTQHNTSVNVGNETLHDQGLGWVILQYDITINRRPDVFETITIETFADSYNPYFARRTYYFKDDAGEQIVEIQSLWAMIDMEKRHLARLPHQLIEKFGARLVKQIEKLPSPATIQSVNERATYQTRYFDIDSNQHVNNSKYFDWMLNPLGMDFLSTHEPQNINIKFEQEVLFGQSVTSDYQRAQNKTLHCISADGENKALAEFTWDK